ncbi:hypothetical protein FGU65_05255 [Methanoculleus sp. FWC-SCC1]|uniref:Dockerin domain-containing protein n=1 Tax=Methanoculleus frigidifontis TaxID=2584085 RepID=A0ABT8M8R3_9EURY|nr:dockerin type I domain-containing protein [Methanoculleus sp. FWC-SCC1]MDN7024304.1 hypothetical protein [Methanoculleus sp. FWC-SCC1]
MKHIVWSILLLTFLCGVGSAATLSVDPASSTCAYGQTVNLAVTAADVSNLGGFDIDLRWNPQIVALSSAPDNVTKGALVNSIEVNRQSGRIRVAGVNSTLDGINGDATLFTATFTAVDDTGRTTPVTLIVNNYGFLNSTSGEDIPVSGITNASITTLKHNVVYSTIGVVSNRMLLDQENTLVASVTNQRGTATSPLDISVEILDETNASVDSWTYNDEVIPAWGSFTDRIAWTPAQTGRYRAVITVTSDDSIGGKTTDAKGITVVDYTLEYTNGYVYGPWSKVQAGNWFSMRFYVNASHAGNIWLNITAPDYVEVNGGRNQSRYMYASQWNYVRVYMRTDRPGTIDADQFRFDIAAHGKSDTVNGTDVSIWIPSIEVTSVDATTINASAPGAMTFNTLHTNRTFDNRTDIIIQSGARGRTLSGLEYLVGYPYGCVEQTTSRMMASLNVKNYYLDRPADRPSNWQTIRDTANTSIERGITSLVKGGQRGQHADGGWSLWGSGSSESSSSSYASYTLARINKTDEDLNRLLVDKVSNGSTVTSGTVNFEKLIEWFHDNPDNPSTGTWTWSANVCHSWTPQSNTAFVMLIHDMINQTADVQQPYRGYMEENMQNATRYFIDTQNIDGSWSSGQDQAMATGLALWGLESFALTSDDVTAEEIENAKAKAAVWLIDTQNADGSWPAGSHYGWYTNGRVTEATAYGVLALNATGIPADNTTISRAVGWLVSQYEDRGSWGYTWASQVAIDALIQCQPNVVSTGTVTVAIDGTDVCTVPVNSTHPRVVYTLTEAQEEALLAGGTLKRDIFGDGFSTVKEHDVTATLTSGDGPILVSVDHSQHVPIIEVDATIRNGRTIQEFGDETGSDLVQISTDIGVLDYAAQAENPYTVGFASSPSPMVAGEEADVTLTVTSTQDVFSPMVEIPISGFAYDNASTVYENGQAVASEVTNSTASTDQLSLFIEPLAWVNNTLMTYTFTATPDTYGALEMNLRIRPLYDESQVTFANHTFTVQGRGNVSVNVVDENGDAVTADRISVGASSVTAVSNHTFEDVLEGTYSMVVNKTGYPEIHSNVNVTPGATALYNVTLPSTLTAPVLVLSEGGSGSIAGVAQVPPETLNALRNENTSYNVTVLGNGGELGIALEFPMRYLLHDPVVTVNGVPTAYEFRNGTFTYPVGGAYTTTNATLVIYDAPNGQNTIGLGFEGVSLGESNNDGSVNIIDALYIASYDAQLITGLATYDYPDVTGDGVINIIDALYVASYDAGLLTEYYQPVA